MDQRVGPLGPRRRHMSVRITWDVSKHRLNLEKHGLDFGIVTLDFVLDAIVRPAKQGRLQAIGEIDGKAVSLIFSLLGTEAISLISLRAASERGRALL